MTLHTYLKQGVSILHARMQSPMCPEPPGLHVAIQPFVTISRETGAGATTLGRELMPLFARELGEDGAGWIFLDKDLLVQALTHHQLPARLAEFLPEDRISEVQAAIGELVGLHPPLWELEEKVSDAILHLARMGRVIFAGRAAHLVTRALPGGLHIRLVASPDSRIRRMATLLQCDPRAAAAYIEKNDHARRRYLRTRFGRDIDDAHLYDLVLNTDHFAPGSAARIVLAALRDRLEIQRAALAVYRNLPRLTKEELTPIPTPDTL